MTLRCQQDLDQGIPCVSYTGWSCANGCCTLSKSCKTRD